jgi:hypothetical protein
MLFSSFNHLGYLLFLGIILGNPIIPGNPDGFSIFVCFSIQNRGIKNLEWDVPLLAINNKNGVGPQQHGITDPSFFCREIAEIEDI